MRDDQLYSIIISDLGNYLEPAFLQPRVYVYNEDGTIKESNNGTPCGRYANSLDYENGQNGIRDNPIYHFSTPVHTYQSMNDAQKVVANEVKRFLNHRPMCCMWHNGTADQDCQFSGLHMHIVMHSS